MTCLGSLSLQSSPLCKWLWHKKQVKTLSWITVIICTTALISSRTRLFRVLVWSSFMPAGLYLCACVYWVYVFVFPQSGEGYSLVTINVTAWVCAFSPARIQQRGQWWQRFELWLHQCLRMKCLSSHADFYRRVLHLLVVTAIDLPIYCLISFTLSCSSKMLLSFAVKAPGLSRPLSFLQPRRLSVCLSQSISMFLIEELLKVTILLLKRKKLVWFLSRLLLLLLVLVFLGCECPQSFLLRDC